MTYQLDVAYFLILVGTFIGIVCIAYVIASLVYARTQLKLLEEKGARVGAGMIAATLICLIFFG